MEYFLHENFNIQVLSEANHYMKTRSLKMQLLKNIRPVNTGYWTSFTNKKIFDVATPKKQ